MGDRRLIFPAGGLVLCGVEHPVENVQQRAEGWERGRPITIGANCWFDPGTVVNEDIPLRC